MDYTGKQKAKLRRLANEKPIMFQIGMAGLTDNIINQINENLLKHEVGRVTVLKTCPDDINDIIIKLGQNGIYVVYKIGRVLLMYKSNPNLKDRIVL
ncbi:MAG: YhbY family RNA-binding protein [Candidatus Izemoplasmatales bacterium]|nr:YhbY family RNA-binding protein [Candidatus Izemoplasmatales bacterium]MDD4070403.1 YhbY family RNA-binding protein [Candidatus Izemoplasmatales bacterium]MDY0140000.1 YhbY family RNA-binding protein [Candidatus Izemoplasmatales bacterium]